MRRVSMTKSTMNGPMAGLAQTGSVGYIISVVRILGKGFDVMRCQSTSYFLTLRAFITSSLHDSRSPLSIDRPIPGSLSGPSEISFVVPVILSSQFCRQFLSALVRAYSFAVVRLVCHLNAATLAVECANPSPFIVGRSSSSYLPESLNFFWSSLSTSGLVCPPNYQKGRPREFNASLLEPIPDSLPGYPVLSGYQVNTKFFNKIHVPEFLFCWSGRHD